MPLNSPIATLVVGISGVVSWTATASLIAFTAWLFVIAHRRHDANAKAKIRFLRTQFGVLFINMLAMDLVQSTAFATNFYWYAKDLPPSLDSNIAACRSQGIFIQAADIGCALFSVFIALHTAAFIMWRARPSARVFAGLVATVWLLVVIATVIGPAHVAYLRATSNPATPLFYDTAGLWCWISSDYDEWRLYAHYLWVFISAATSLSAYLAVFLFIWFRLFRRSAYSLNWLRLRKAVDRELIPNLGDAEKQASTASGPTCERDKTLDKAAVTMLLYPVSYICCILPLATFRLGRMTNASWAANNPNLQAACGCLFTLNGLCNVVLYVSTRHVYRGEKASAGKSSDEGFSALSISDANAIEILGQRDMTSYKMMVDAGIVRPSIDFGRRESEMSLGYAKHVIGLPAKKSTSRRSGQNELRRPSALSQASKPLSDGLSIDLSSDEEDEEEEEEEVEERHDEEHRAHLTSHGAWQQVNFNPDQGDVHYATPLHSPLSEIPPALTHNTDALPVRRM